MSNLKDMNLFVKNKQQPKGEFRFKVHHINKLKIIIYFVMDVQ